MRPCTLQFLAGGQVTDTQHGAWAPGPNSAFGFAAGAVAMVGTHASAKGTANGFASTVSGEFNLALDPNPPKP